MDPVAHASPPLAVAGTISIEQTRRTFARYLRIARPQTIRIKMGPSPREQQGVLSRARQAPQSSVVSDVRQLTKYVGYC